jgi:hypothetical protein
VKDDRVYLEHIRDALADIATYTSAGSEAFFDQRIRQDATLRKLEVIGQAVKNLSEKVQIEAAADTLEANRRNARQSDSRLLWRQPRHRMGGRREGSSTIGTSGS